MNCNSAGVCSYHIVTCTPLYASGGKGLRLKKLKISILPGIYEYVFF